MSLSLSQLAAASRALLGRHLSPPPIDRLIRPPPELLARLRNLHQLAGTLAATAPDILAHPEVARALEDALVRAMVACLGTGPEADHDHSPRKRMSVMRGFEEALERHPDEPVYLTEICHEIGVSGRTLRLHCQEHLGMSPHRYLWLRRMHLVRHALARPDATHVTAVAIDHGFGELGRFSVEYRRLFGETPSATLHRSKMIRAGGASICNSPGLGPKIPLLP
jgi:AraC-like DNA-binding protein